MNYDVGRILQGRLTRTTFDPQVVHRELDIIKNDLHCNSVKIQSYDVNRLISAAEHALTLGLEVWLSPEIFEQGAEETFDYTVRAASEIEKKLREKWSDGKIVLSIGTELTLFMQGILEGKTLMERIGNPSIWQKIRSGTYNRSLNDYLKKISNAVRNVFHGEITYASVARIENVDWSIFDYVCIDAYRDKLIRNSFDEMLKRYFDFGKPVVVGEFGCCTYRGAEDRGGMGWDILDFSETLPRLKGNYVYDQATQAREVAEELAIFDSVGVYGAFVFTFVQPPIEMDERTMNFVRDLKIDLDTPTYSLVKSYPDNRQGGYLSRYAVGTETVIQGGCRILFRKVKRPRS